MRQSKFSVEPKDNPEIEMLLENCTDAIFALNKEWEIVYLNAPAEKHLGKSRENLLGKNIWYVFPSLKGTAFYNNYFKAMLNQITVTFEEFFVPLNAWFEARVFPFKGGITVYFRDITESKHTLEELKMSNERLKESEQKFRQLFQNVNDAIFLHGYQENGMPDKFIEVNDRACKVFGYSKEEFFKIGPIELDGQDNNEELDKTSEKVVKSGNTTFERILITKDGRKIPFELNTHIFELNNKTMALSVARDISKRKEAEQEILYMAYHDSLTDLPNRRLFNETLAATISKAGQQGTRVGIVFLDLDKFKNINDTLGHEVGDKLLQQIAGELKGFMKDNTLVARMGGDEFILLIPDLESEKRIDSILQDIEIIFSKEWNVETNSLNITPSIGVSIYPTDGQDAVTILKNADIAMYQAKDLGGNKVQRFQKNI